MNSKRSIIIMPNFRVITKVTMYCLPKGIGGIRMTNKDDLVDFTVTSRSEGPLICLILLTCVTIFIWSKINYLMSCC